MMRAFGLTLLLVTVLAIPIWSAGESKDIAFETIVLKNGTAGEIAPLFGASFQFLGKEAPAEAESGQASQGALSAFLPEGVTLLTAGSPTSRNLLAAGTAQAVAELREFISLLDHKAPEVPVTVAVYPSLPMDKSGWERRRQSSVGSLLTAIMYAPKEKAGRLPTFPLGVEPTQIELSVRSLTPELMSLPAYKGLPQLLLCLIPRINAGGTITMTLSFSEFGDPAHPEAAVRQARFGASSIVNVRPDEDFAVTLEREDRGITVFVRAGKPVGQAASE